jgi:glucose-1-phosphate adenylyltransferase
LLDKDKNVFLQNPDWKIYTVENNNPPFYLDYDATVQHSLLNEGCEIYGRIEHSVIFNGVKVGKGSVIKNSVILPYTIIESNVTVENAVIGSNSRIQSGVTIQSENTSDLAVVGDKETIDYNIYRKEYSQVM